MPEVRRRRELTSNRFSSLSTRRSLKTTDLVRRTPPSLARQLQHHRFEVDLLRYRSSLGCRRVEVERSSHRTSTTLVRCASSHACFLSSCVAPLHQQYAELIPTFSLYRRVKSKPAEPSTLPSHSSSDRTPTLLDLPPSLNLRGLLNLPLLRPLLASLRRRTYHHVQQLPVAGSWVVFLSLGRSSSFSFVHR